MVAPPSSIRTRSCSINGAPGGPEGVTAEVMGDGKERPAALMAETVNV